MVPGINNNPLSSQNMSLVGMRRKEKTIVKKLLADKHVNNPDCAIVMTL
jgi:hypothetical protein